MTRERALVYPELVIGKRVFEPKIRPSEVKPESGAADIKPETGVADIPKKTWGSRLKSLALDTVIGGGAALIGTDIYSHMNPDSAALGDSSPPAESTGATSDTTAFPTASQGYNTPNYSTTNPGSSTTGPNYATTNPGSSTNGPTTNPGSSTTGPNYATTNSGSPASTGPGSSTTGSSPTTTYYPGTDPGSTPYPYYNPPSTRAIAERAREERTLDHKHKLSLGISSESSIQSHV